MNQQQKSKTKKGSGNARSTAARLAAVQAVYQSKLLDKKPQELVDEYINYRLGEAIEGEEAVMPDGGLFSSIIKIVGENLEHLNGVILDALQQGKEGERTIEETSIPEPLLYAILLCGAAELFGKQNIDAPIIISDYLHVTHAFYGQGEHKLVNAVLDRLNVVLR